MLQRFTPLRAKFSPQADKGTTCPSFLTRLADSWSWTLGQYRRHFQIRKVGIVKAVLRNLHIWRPFYETFTSLSPPASYPLVLSNTKLLAGNP